VVGVCWLEDSVMNGVEGDILRALSYYKYGRSLR